MKKYISIVLVLVLILLMTGCDSYDYLTEIEEYSSMTVDGTTSIEVGYTYVAEEKTFYEFVIEDKAIINEIMAEIFKIELKEYPDARIDFYHRTINISLLRKFIKHNRLRFIIGLKNIRLLSLHMNLLN